jgi:hypothetical protein
MSRLASIGKGRDRPGQWQVSDAKRLFGLVKKRMKARCKKEELICNGVIYKAAHRGGGVKISASQAIYF